VKRGLAIGVYLVAFGAHLYFLYPFANPELQRQWRYMLDAFGGEPVPGTDLLLFTTRWWWMYVLLGAFIFVYGMLHRRKTVGPLIYSILMALIWGFYFLYPNFAMSPVV
jgi:hypothetical protein